MAVIILFLISVELMLLVAEYLFWLCIIIIFYTYAGYPLLIYVLVSVKRLITNKKQLVGEYDLPPVTLIIAACNEEKIIAEKLDNTVLLSYPPGRLKFIFITDGSTDETRAIVSGYPQVELMHQPERKGKLAAVNRAMRQVTTDFVVFSDANAMLNSNCLEKIMVHYADARVGGVAGEKKVGSGEGVVSGGEGAYWKYESFLKKLDSDLYTTVGAAGELFSIRTSLYVSLPEHIIIEDFVQSLLLCIKGYRVKYESGAWAGEKASVSVKDEMERKIRITAGAFQAMGMLKPLFNVFRFPVVFFQLISHRILRWTLCPLALVILFIVSGILVWNRASPLYSVAFIFQLLLYSAAAAGWYAAVRNRRSKAFYLPFYFIFMHLCVFAGLWRFVRRKQDVLWRKAARG